MFRLAFGSGMAASIVLGFAAIRRGDVPRHRAWMTRAYALALGAGTQAFTQGIGAAVLGPSELVRDLMLGAGWVINLAVAELVIRRPLPPAPGRPSRAATVMAHSTGPTAIVLLASGSRVTSTTTGPAGSVTVHHAPARPTAPPASPARSWIRRSCMDVLIKVRDLGVALISVARVEPIR